MAECVQSSRQEGSNGLAVIVTNDYHYRGSTLKQLTETHRDGEELVKVFGGLNYSVEHWKNLSWQEMEALLQRVSQTKPPHAPSDYCIVVSFSGHGTIEQIDGEVCKCIYTQDAIKFPIDAIVQLLVVPSIALIPKVFLIDACLGEKSAYNEAITVPRGSTNGIVSSIEDRGGRPVRTICLPPDSNYILAFSTSQGYQSYEIKGRGGVWLTKVSEKIQSRAHCETVFNILSEASKELLEMYQSDSHRLAMTQPTIICKPIGKIYFVPQAISQAQESSQQAPVHNGSSHTTPSPATNGTSPPVTSKGYYRGELNSLQQSGKLSGLKHNEWQPASSGGFLASVEFKVTATGSPCCFQSPTPKPSKKEAWEEAARCACNSSALNGLITARSPQQRQHSLTSQTSVDPVESDPRKILNERCQAQRYTVECIEISTGLVECFKFKLVVKKAAVIICEKTSSICGSKKDAKIEVATLVNKELGF